MRHAKIKYQLNRFTSWRKATVLSLVRNLFISQSIRTTEARAKAARPIAEKLISLAKKNTLAAKREAYALLSDHALVSKLFGEIGQRFSQRSGGYTRIVNFSQRRGDDARMVIFELTEIKKEPRKTKKAKEAAVKEEAHGPKAEGAPQEKQAQEKEATEPRTAVKERPPITQKPRKKFLGGLKGIFKKERDSL
ncbi:MAG: 50S ribosomal protein L17 [Candidatus Omnitrophota bacterium]|jgi:large subunit ribosomal protein L17